MEETLFSSNVKKPLADRLRPRSLDEVVGQDNIIGENAPLGRMLKAKRFRPLFCGGLRVAARRQLPV